MDNRSQIRALPLFRQVPGEVAERLLSAAQVETVRAGALLFTEGEAPIYLHALLDGVVELSRVDGPRECGVLLLGKDDVFMPAAALWGEPYLTSARCLTRGRLVFFPVATVRDEVNASPELALAIGKVLSGHFRMAVRHILDLKCRSGPERLARLLLRLVDETPFGDPTELPFPKRYLASRVGLRPESLSRAIQVLAGHGLFLRGRHIIVRDRASIERFCGPDPYPQRTEHSLDVHAL